MPRQLDHDRVISSIAARNHGVVSRAAMREAGIPVSIIDERVRMRRLVVLHRGVYALGHAELRAQGWWLAAVDAYGASAALSYGSAAMLWGLLDAPLFDVHVTVAKRSGVGARRRVVVHRVTDLPAAETVPVELTGEFPVNSTGSGVRPRVEVAAHVDVARRARREAEGLVER